MFEIPPGGGGGGGGGLYPAQGLYDTTLLKQRRINVIKVVCLVEIIRIHHDCEGRIE